MQGVRRTAGAGNVTDGRARLSLNKRQANLVGGTAAGGAASSATKGAKSAAKKTAAAGGVLAGTAGATERDQDNDERAAEVSNSALQAGSAKAGRAAADAARGGLRRGGGSSGKAVRGGVMAGQRRAQAAATAKSAKVSTVDATVTVGRASQAAARATAAAAGFVRGVAAAVTTLASSAPVLAIIMGIVVALVAIVSIIGWLIPVTESSAKPTPTLGAGAVVGIGGWVSPVAAGTVVTSDYGPRPSICTPAGCTKPWHNGIDLPQGCGAPVMAAADGVVENAGLYGDFGNAVILDHVYNGQSMTTMYAHLETGSIPIVLGQTVKAGTVIGHEGDTGKSAGCHLHIEMTINGLSTNPRTFLASVGLTYQ